MKRVGVVLILAIIPLLASCTPAQKPVGAAKPTASASASIGVDQGLKIIQKLFPDESGIQFISKDKIASEDELLYGNDAARFWVNAKTGALDSFQLTHQAESGKSALALEEARDAAKTYIQKYRSDIDFSKMTPTIGKLLDHGANSKEYEFEWRRYKDGVDIGTYAMVMLTPDGVLKFFSACNNDANTPDLSTAADLGEQKAVQIALDYVKDKTTPERYAVIKVDKTEKVVWKNNQNRLTWIVSLSSSGVDKEPIVYGFVVFVDAQTGEIVNYNCY